MASTPSDTSVATSVKTRIPLKPRPQYSVEVVDLEILLLLKVEGTPAGFWPLAFVETTNTLGTFIEKAPHLGLGLTF
jgi:hypothetical protein